MQIPVDWCLNPLEDGICVVVKKGRWVWGWEIRHYNEDLRWEKAFGRGMSHWAFTKNRAFRQGRRRVEILREHEMDRRGAVEYWEEV